MVIYLGYNYFSKSDASVLGDTTAFGGSVNLKPVVDTIVKGLPPQSQEIINNFNQQPFVINTQYRINQVKEQLDGFPDKQIKDIKKSIVQNIYDELIKSIEQK